jgi:hypothetical protein
MFRRLAYIRICRGGFSAGVGRRPGDLATLGCSKFGGLPDVDSECERSTGDDTDEPLALVCRLGNVYLHGDEAGSFKPASQTLLLHVSGPTVDKAAFGEGSFDLIIDKRRPRRRTP